jgi:carnitine-CoA ligase
MVRVSLAEGVGGDLLALVQRACEAEPEKPALIFEDGVVVTRQRLWSEVQSFAGYLESRVTAGDRVAIMLGNRAEFMVAWLSVVACRTVLVSINPSAKSHDAGHILRDSGARVAIVDRECAEICRQLQPSCADLEEIVVVEGEEPSGLARCAVSWSGEREAVASGDLTNVYYTSGTTGPPKGCMVDHSYWLRFVDLVQNLYKLDHTDRLLCCLQFFYNDPPWQLLVSLAAGTSLVVMRRFSVSKDWNVVRQHDVTILFGIASTASLLLKAPVDGYERDHKVRLMSIRVGIPAALHVDLDDRWGFPWVEAYGLTETGLVTATPVERSEEMVGTGSIGLPCPGAEIRLVDSHGEDVELGEVIVRAPGLMRGYLNNLDATEDVFRGGWLHTGDLARKDERGFLYFRGRIKDIIRRSGENIAAAEVENVLRSHPKVLEVAAVPAPDPLRGEEVKVHVLLAPGETSLSMPPQELVAFSEERLAHYKVPRFLQYRTADFDRTPSMRVKKRDLDRSVEDRTLVFDREAAFEWVPLDQMLGR